MYISALMMTVYHCPKRWFKKEEEAEYPKKLSRLSKLHLENSSKNLNGKPENLPDFFARSIMYLFGWIRKWEFEARFSVFKKLFIFLLHPLCLFVVSEPGMTPREAVTQQATEWSRKVTSRSIVLNAIIMAIFMKNQNVFQKYVFRLLDRINCRLFKM